MLGMNLQTELSISRKKISDKIKYCFEIIPYYYQVCYYIHCSNQMWFKINPLIALRSFGINTSIILITT